MIFFYIFITIALGYFFLMFFVSRLVVPFMGFGKYLPPINLPTEISDVIRKLENSSADQKTYLETVYNLILDKTLHQWHHTRFQAAFKFPRAFVKNLEEIWQTQNFIYCTAINYLIVVMLVNSKFFQANDVRIRHVFVNFFIHQYLTASSRWRRCCNCRYLLIADRDTRWI